MRGFTNLCLVWQSFIWSLIFSFCLFWSVRMLFCYSVCWWLCQSQSVVWFVSLFIVCHSVVSYLVWYVILLFQHLFGMSFCTFGLSVCSLSVRLLFGLSACCLVWNRVEWIVSPPLLCLEVVFWSVSLLFIVWAVSVMFGLEVYCLDNLSIVWSVSLLCRLSVCYLVCQSVVWCVSFCCIVS